MQHITRFTEFDIHLFKSGTHYHLYDKLGSHIMEVHGVKGTYFAVWAPNARSISVIGNFNGWNKDSHPMNPRYDSSGIWETFVPNIGQGETYKYRIVSNVGGRVLEKSDVYAKYWETPPLTATKVWDIEGYEWQDSEWMEQRKATAGEPKPYSIYEVHLGSWKRKSDRKEDYLTYRDMANDLVEYVKEMGFTHVELLPITEHPYAPSWGYQAIGYFAPTSRFGTPQDFMYLVDKFHQAGISILMDWVPSHFPADAHALADYDGTHLYDHADPRLGFHPDWKSCIFNYDRNEIREFLISSAIFWLDKYHIDGIRVDAVASMLYLDYSRKAGEWIPNIYGGNHNLGAISFLKQFNKAVRDEFPDVVTIAEESTSFDGVTRTVDLGGLGFDQKWMMGWMNDTLEYMKKNPIYRKHHHGQLTFSLVYAFSEKFMLPLSHDEVVHGKGSLLKRMPGDEWQRFANLRLMYGYMFTHPGTQLLFMGCEFGQIGEWNHETSLDWHLLQQAPHKNTQNWVKALNHYYKSHPALFQNGFSPEGFEWIDLNDAGNSVLTYIRKGIEGQKTQVIVCHFTPSVIHSYRIGVPEAGSYVEVLNSDATEFGGSGIGHDRPVLTQPQSWQGRDHSMEIVLPPLGMICFELESYDIK
jgi:1,4-alpha-glucan branching enzyme